MSADGQQQPLECLAIAFLVEASLNVSYEWRQLFQDYVFQLFQRCSIAPNKLTRVGFVTYGTADTQPSPIVRSTFFTELRNIFQDIKDDSRRLGIGQTDSGGGKGMAALEGFASVLDMFDLLRNMTMGPKELDCRVVHIAASPPDNSEHPQWNQSPALDSLTWDVLPSELKKRNIQLSGINLSSGLPRFPELYTQTAIGTPTTPWFSVRTAHHLFISGFTAAPPKVQATVAKRAADTVPPDRTPETKRARIASAQPPTEAATPTAPPQASPSVPSMQVIPSTSPVIPPTGANTSQPAPQPGSQPNPGATLPQPVQARLRLLMTQMQPILQKKQQIEEEVKMFHAGKQAAVAQGNTQQANMCDVEIAKRREAHQKLNQALLFCQTQVRRMQAQAQSATGAPGTAVTTDQQGQEAAQPPQSSPSALPISRTVTSPSAPNTKEPQTTFNSATTPRQPSVVQSPNMNPQMAPARSISASGVPPSTPNPNPNPPQNNTAPPMMPGSMSSGLTAQMQKLLQANRNRNPSGSDIGPGPNAPPMPAVEGGNSTGMMPNPTSQPSQQQPAQPPNGNPNQIQSVLVWEGILSFNGTGSDGNKKEVHTRVSASSSNASNSHANTWPSSMILVPAQTPAVSIAEFQDWIRRTKPVLCTFKARTPEDESNYSMLVSVMSTKRMYATASWQLPNGPVKENVLIFPINNMGLCGAFFPLTGITEMPKGGASTSAPTPQIPPQILHIIAQLPPEQRQAAVLQFRAKLAVSPEAARAFLQALVLRQQQLQQQQQSRAAMANQFGLNPTLSQPGSMGTGGGGGAPNAMGMMGMNTMNGMVSNPFAAMGNASNMMANMPRAGAGGGPAPGMNLNYDVLQSFMQRNHPDSNNGPGMGP
ncbi:hypothetical protein NP233_g9408 [Leucocoprinus birnbaumii]|uniref:Mediator of RNA polymerase II transcription subunit 25 von Willebrand factor type A domain-containing protein n=1 Tax=Leucocoprinus birnbaumii TaxID=56174 RepID=A0AAD5VR41_9AGAR|nr:hypothetical protein NP233_g9408 [Leucocoprinus birnbaumii]